jgi:hypothetical protein
VVDKHGNIIIGNKTYEAWGELSEAVEVVHSDGHKLVVVQRDDLDLTDPTGSARQLAYLDNRTSEVSLKWDADIIAQDLQAGCDITALWRQDELETVFASLSTKTGSGMAPQDKPPVTCPACGHTFPLPTKEARHR